MSQDEGEDTTQNLPPPPPWIRRGIVLKVTDGNKSIEYVADTKSDPFLCDDIWFVTIRYSVSFEQKDVECSRCIPIDLEEDRRSTLRRRAAIVKVEEMKGKAANKKQRVHGPPPMIDLTSLTDSSDDELKSLSSFSFSSEADRDCEPAADASDEVEQLSVARMPPPEEYDGDESAAFGDFFPVTPSPNRSKVPKRRGLGRPGGSGSVAQVSDELFGTDESDEDSDMNKKPAARNLSKEVNYADVEEDEGEEEEPENAEKFEAAKKILGNLSYSTKEVEAALHEIGPPYTKLQTAALEIQRKRSKQNSLFDVEIGMVIRRPFLGKEYEGVVLYKVEEETRKNGVVVDVWHVVYSDGDQEDLDYDELLRFRCPRPEMPECLGRPMQGLELFCGECDM